MVIDANANWIRRNLPVVIAFIIPVVILSVIFICTNVFPFGNEMYLRSDMYHQYTPFMRVFQRVLKEGGSLSYNWEIGLGSNFASTYAYYLASPLNWVIAFFPGAWVPAVMDAFIVLKCGLMSATFTYYLLVRFANRTWFAPLFGVFYAMSSYMAAFSWNLMWLDCLVLLPLIMLGLERLVKQKKVILYTVTLAAAVLSNYYIGIMIAFFLILYYLYLVFFDRGDHRFVSFRLKAFGASLLRFAGYSLLAGCMAMATVLPAICALSGTASGDFNFPKTFLVYNNMLEVLSKGTILTETAVFSGYFPNIFCTCALFILVPLYWINKHINLQRKMGMTILILLFLLCFDANIPTYIWHGFHFPNSLPCRQSFIYIALVLIVAYEALIRYRQYTRLQIILVAGLGVAGNILFYILFRDEDFTLLTGAVTAAFALVYALVLLLLIEKKLRAALVTLLLFVLCIGESALNTAYTGYSTASYKTYTEDNEALTALLDTVQDDGFYRVEKVRRRTKNDGAWSDYRSASIFSSETLDGITQLYDALGMQSSMNAFSYYGHTPFVAALLGVKYEFSSNEMTDPLKQLYFMQEYGNDKRMYLYQNQYALGLGYAVDEFADMMLDLSADNPFENQNELAFYLTGVYDLFDVQDEVEGVIAEGVFHNEGRGFIYISDKIETANIKIFRNGIEVVNRDMDDLENPQIIDLGSVRKGDRIAVEALDEEHSGEELTVIPAVMDYDALEDVYGILSENQLSVEQFEADHIKGTIHLDEGKMLFTTIAAEKGWRVYVDGQEVPCGVFKNAFLYVDLPEGTHEVEFRFAVPGQAVGFVLCGLALAVFLLTLFLRSYVRNRPKKP